MAAIGLKAAKELSAADLAYLSRLQGELQMAARWEREFVDQSIAYTFS